MKRKHRHRVGPSLVAFVLGLALFAAPASAGELDDLKAQLEALRKRIEELEAREKSRKAEEVKAKKMAAPPGYWKPAGSNTSLSFSGYVKLDAIYDLNSDLGDAFSIYDAGGRPSPIGLDGSDTKPKASMHARQTRLRFESKTPTEMGELKSRVETDFFGSGSTLRLRHAWVSLGSMMAGRNWSTMVDQDTYADTVDFEGPVGVIASRYSQLRYSSDMGGGLTAEVALEDAGGPAIVGSSVVSSEDRLPNLVAALRYRQPWGAINLGGLVGQIRHEQGDLDVDTTISAFHLGANFKLQENTRLWATFNVGAGGLAAHMLGVPAAATLVSGELETVDSMGGFVGLTHNLNKKLSAGAYYGWVQNDFDDDASSLVAALSESLQSVHLNLWWSPVPKARVGFEYMHGWRETYEGKEGDAARLQLGVQYSF